MKMTHIEIPGQFQRNSPKVLALGVENTGSTLINRGNELLGLADLEDKDVLDIGCGVRFTQTIINRDLPINSYTGIDIDEPLISYLKNHVQDHRFAFHYWPVYNAMYNPKGQKLSKSIKLPLPQDKKFDVIWMYSVLTHTEPWGTECLLSILRSYIKKGGGLLFSAFIDNQIATFEDRIKDQPLLMAYYNENFLKRILAKTGWQVESFYNNWSDSVTQNLFGCRPKSQFWKYFWSRQESQV